MDAKEVLSQIIHPKVMNETERLFIDRLVAAKVLDSPKHHHFDDKFASAIVCCPDGTKIGYTQKLLREMYDTKLRGYVQHHLLTHHGGALVLALNSPVITSGHTTDVDMIEQIKMSVSMGYKSIIVLVHLPCVMARTHNMSPMDMIDALVRAKQRIKENIPDITVACFVQCTRESEKPGKIHESLYFFSKTSYMNWKKENA